MRTALTATALTFVFLKGCEPVEEPAGPAEVTIVNLTGTVADSRTSQPLASAAVRLTNSFITLLDSTDSNGVYDFTIDLGDQDNVSTSLQISRNGYITKTEAVTLTKGATTVRNVSLDVATTPPPPVGSPSSGLPNTIAFIGASLTELSVYGVGGVETATITYEVRDSLGFPITIDRQDTVAFSLSGGPVTGGAYISPDRVLTNQAGRVATTVNSGTVAGSLQLVAALRRDVDGAIIISQPVRLLIHGGLPDQAHFSLYAERYNVEGLVFFGIPVNVTALVGDKYSNPVQPGTKVYFSTTQGVITTTGQTNTNGFVVVQLYTGNPIGANGFGTVSAATVGENGVNVTSSFPILFSGRTIVDSVQVVGGGPFVIDDTTPSQVVSFRVYDLNQNPLTAGTSIGVTTKGASVIAGDVIPTNTLDDTQSQFWTYFAVRISKNYEANPVKTGGFEVVITASGKNGKMSSSLAGTLN
jgi:hypothetical protein